MRLMDMHNHSIYSDGTHTVEEIILNAIDSNFDIIGITDHHRAFFMENPQYKSFDEYYKEIVMLKEKYKNEIKVLAGLEINLNFKKKSELKRIPFEKVNKLDYVLLERVDGVGAFEGIKKFNLRFKELNCIIDRLNCKVGLAHTDLFQLANIYEEEGGLEYIIDKLKKNNIFWEISTQKQYEYYDYIIKNKGSNEIVNLFKKLKESKIEIVAGSDTHLISIDFDRMRLVELCKIINSYEVEKC